MHSQLQLQDLERQKKLFRIEAVTISVTQRS